jgi:hypothetical protein
VLVDLAKITGYYSVESDQSILRNTASLVYNEGRRRVFAHVLRFVDLPDDDLAALERSVRFERQVDRQEGEI